MPIAVSEPSFSEADMASFVRGAQGKRFAVRMYRAVDEAVATSLRSWLLFFSSLFTQPVQFFTVRRDGDGESRPQRAGPGPRPRDVRRAT